jgi:hypothetical protein
VGTSGTYGGSGSQAWRDVRELWTEFNPDPLASPPAPPPSTEAFPPPQTPPPTPAAGPAAATGADLLGAALANALLGRKVSTTDPATISLASIRPHRGAGGGGGAGGAGGGGTSSRAGGGTGSRRSTLTLAARGGAAIGAAQAYRDRDQAALTEFGISLADLDAMSPRQRCAAILDAVLGEAAHPDEQAIRSAAIEEVKKIMNSPAAPSALESVRSFVGNLAVQIGLVELRKNIQSGATSPADALRKERGLKQWVTSKIRTLDLTLYGTVPSVRLHQVAFAMARSALRLMAAR